MPSYSRAGHRMGFGQGPRPGCRWSTMVCAVIDPKTAVLYDDELAPITSSIGFLAAPLDQVARGLERWRAEIHGSAERVPVEGRLLENIRRLEPLTGGVRPRELLVATSNPEWTAVIDCGVRAAIRSLLSATSRARCMSRASSSRRFRTVSPTASGPTDSGSFSSSCSHRSWPNS